MMSISKAVKTVTALVAVTSFFQFSSCTDDDPPGFDQAINPIWQYNFNIGLTTGIAPFIYEDRVIYAAYEAQSSDLRANQDLLAFDKESGELLWTWNDHFEPEFQNFGSKSLRAVHNDIMAATIGSRNFAINLKDGTTLWKNRNITSTSSDDVSSFGDLLFRTDFGFFEVDGFYRDAIMVADFTTGEWEKVYEVTGGDSLQQGLEVPSFYTASNGDLIGLFTNTELDVRTNDVFPSLISYNFTTNEELYTVSLDENPNNSSAVDWFPVIDGKQVYIAVDDMLVCHNVETGARIWKQDLNSNLLSAGFILVEGRIYAKSEGNGILWCIDALNGNVIWQVPSTGLGSRLYHHNGLLYWIGDNVLNIAEMSTGQTIATVRAPSSFKNSDDPFAPRMGLDSETGNLYLMSYTTAYCYPPLR